MGRKIGIRILGVFAAAVCLAAPFCSFAAESASGEDSGQALAKEMPGISQVDAVLPEVTVFFNEEIPEEVAQETEAFLGDEPLAYTGTGMTGSRGIHYYLLLDISGSIPDSYFADIKEGMAEFIEGLPGSDQATLLAFGDEIAKVWDSQEQGEPVREALEDIGNHDQTTVLFEALEHVCAEAGEETGGKRSVVIAATDGEDFTLGNTTAQEALDALNESSIPVYGMAVSSAAKEDIDSFGEFSRNSGGELWLLERGEAGEILGQIASMLRESSYITFRADTNRVPNEVRKLVLTYPDPQVSVSRDVLLTKWEPDRTAPEITEVEKVSEQALKLRFSEEVLGADKSSAWKVSWNGTDIPVDSVQLGAEENSVELRFADVLYEGEYEIQGIGITDNSQEENALAGSVSRNLDGPVWEEEKDRSWVTPALLAAVLVGLVAFAAVVWAVYEKVKKNRGVVYVDGKPVLVSQTERHERIPVETRQGRKITIYVDAGGGQPRVIEAVLDRSLFIGRSPICNYSFDDASLSKQHFVIEEADGQLFVTDLGSKNGTKINGVPVTRRHRLDKQDVITAGRIHFRIRW